MITRVYSCDGQRRAEATRAAAPTRLPERRAPPRGRAATGRRAAARAILAIARARRDGVDRAQALLTGLRVRAQHKFAPAAVARPAMREREREIRRGQPRPTRSGHSTRQTLSSRKHRRAPPFPIHSDRRTDKNQSDKSINSKTDNVQPACRSGSSPDLASQAREGNRARALSCRCRARPTASRSSPGERDARRAPAASVAAASARWSAAVGIQSARVCGVRCPA